MMKNNKPKVTVVLKNKQGTAVSQFTPSINNLTAKSKVKPVSTKFPKPMQVQALKSRMPQYGDKKYKPSDGKGVGY